MPALLSAGLCKVAQAVDRADGYCVFAFLQKISDVKGERDVAADMISGVAAVDPYIRFIVARADVQKGAFTPFFRQGEGAAIPYAVHKICVADAGKAAFRAEGHGDFMFKREILFKAPFCAREAVIVLKLPLSVEIHPMPAHQLRSWMLRSWNRV